LPILGDGDWQSLDHVSADVIAQLARAYATADPFPHLVLDGLFDPHLLHGIFDSFAEIPAESWGRSSHPLQRKQGTVTDVPMPPIARHYFDNMHAVPMRRFLSRITGIDGLEPDPSLLHAGMHDVPHGGHFELHVDFAHHPQTLQRNRIVVITYLNDGWQADFGGGLELWRWKPREHAATVQPVFGRTIIMQVGPHNVHGHPDPVHAPDGRSRRSVAAYFYTRPDPAEAARGEDVTGYVDRPGARWTRRTLRFLHTATPRRVAGQMRRLFGRH
jgi:hypothetical protein